MATKKTYSTSSVTSKDGTNVGYRQMGSGTGIILMHGGANASQHFMKLGEFLSDSFTVYIPDRRGRGLSGPFGDNYSMEREIEDLEAITTKTGAHYIFGLSSGALITLQAALKLPAIKKVALYEPPLDIDGSIMKLLAFVPKFDKEIEEGKLSDATVTMLKDFGIYFGLPKWITSLPRSVLVGLFQMYYAIDSKITKGDDVPFTVLVPDFHYDYELVREMQGKLETFKEVNAVVLLIGGSESPQFLKNTFDALEKTIPHVKRIELPGLNHTGPLVTGNPEKIARELKLFFMD